LAKANEIPKRLYKYRAFSNLTLDMLVNDKIFFADPSTFNDPLDTRPSLNTDLSAQNLQQILAQFVERRVSAEMKAAASQIKYRGPKTVKHIARQSRQHADQLIAQIHYDATNPEYETVDSLQFILGHHVEQELLRQYEKGICSLAERVNCPLMWSHYGDQHHGVCLGYSVPADAATSLLKVKYGGSRFVEASKVAAMLKGDQAAQEIVDEAVLLRKAYDWRYEREWRLIARRGLQNSPLELEEVVFGIRCSSSVIFTVIKALEARRRPVEFYVMRELHGTFKIKKYAVDTGELNAFLPMRSLDVYDHFKNIVTI
jgi:Protein of unknown function (DUF2971)